MEFQESIVGELRKPGEKKADKICCVIYSKNLPNGITFFLEKKLVKKIDHFINKNRQLNYLFNLEIDGKKYKAIVRERQRDYVKNEVFHMDFLELHKDSKTKMKIEVVFLNKGSSTLEKTNKVFLMSSPKTIPVICYGDQSISTINVDLNNVSATTTLYSEDLLWPSNVKCIFRRVILRSVMRKIVTKVADKKEKKK